MEVLGLFIEQTLYLAPCTLHLRVEPKFLYTLTAPKYITLYLITAVLFGMVNGAIFWFSLMWFVAGSDLLQMWSGIHLITFAIGFTLSFGISAFQAEHIPEVVYRSSQLGSKAVILIPASTAFRAFRDTLLPSGKLSIGGHQFNSVEVFTLGTVIAILLFVLFSVISWLADKRGVLG